MLSVKGVQYLALNLNSQILMLTSTRQYSATNQYRVTSNHIRCVWVILIHIDNCSIWKVHTIQMSISISLYSILLSAEDAQHTHTQYETKCLHGKQNLCSSKHTCVYTVKS